MQGDGNLVLYAPGSTPIWATNTAGNDGAQLVTQTDGNLVPRCPAAGRCGRHTADGCRMRPWSSKPCVRWTDLSCEKRFAVRFGRG